MDRTRRRSALLLVLLAVVINLPLAHSTWTERKIRSAGVEVVGTVTDEAAAPGEGRWVSFTLPADVDPGQEVRRAELTEDAYDAAVASGEVRVRVLEDDPGAYLVEGGVTSRVPLVATLVADGVLLLIALLWRFGRRVRAPLRAVALDDVRRCAPGSLLERLHAEDYLIRGEVLEVADDRVVLDLGDRTVVVRLEGHANPVGHQQAAEVRARLTS